MAKTYLFKEVKYTSLNDLANAYIEYFSDGMDDIYTNSKKLIKFVKSVNKKLYKKVIDYLAFSKYKNNALTFIIFEFLNEKRVIINGRDYTFKQFIEMLRKTEDTTPNVYKSFIEDLGITKTYATMNIEKTLAVDSYYIEKNINDPFVYTYLVTYYEYDIIESLHGKLTTISTYGEECFRRATKLCKRDDFKLALAHKYGFKEAYMAHKEVNPLFKSIRLLKKEVNEDELTKLITDTFYWWLLDNFEKYTYEKEAKSIYNRLASVKAEYDDYQKRIKARKIDGIAFDQMNEFSRTLYLIYLDFADQYEKSNINVKKKIDPADYILDKKYCNTYICTDFMRGKVIKLHQESSVFELEEPVNAEEEYIDEEASLPKEELDPILTDIDDDGDIAKSSLVEEKYSLKRIKKQEKIINKFRTLGRNALFGGFFSLICVVGLYLTAEVIFKDELDSFMGDIVLALFGTADTTTLILSIVATVLIIILSIWLFITASGSEKKYNKFLILKNLRSVEQPSVKQELEIQKLQANEAKVSKKAMKAKRIVTALLYSALSLANTILAIYAVAIINSYVDLFDWYKAYVDNSKIVYYIAGPAIAFILGLLKKKKGFLFAFLNLLLSFGIVFGLAFIL